MIQLLITATRF